jgi:hypothetical protein
MAVTYWLKHYVASRKITGSRPDEANDFFFKLPNKPIAVAERSRAQTVFSRSNTAIVGSNPT